MRTIVGAARFLAVFIYTICCLVIIAFVFPFQGPESRGRVIRRWAGRLLRWLGVKVRVNGQLDEKAAHDTGITPGKTGRLILSNHISFLDIFALDSVLPSGFVAKAEIAKWPVFGVIAKHVGTIFIERGNKRALIGIGQGMQQALKDGKNLLMFPEGTTSDGTKLLKLHANLMEAAVRTQADVVPVVLQYKSGGEIAVKAAYVGDTGLFECLWHVVTLPDLTVEITILAPRKGDDRHALCRTVSADMAAVMGVVDPMPPLLDTTVVKAQAAGV
ncbi:MAG: lysophospholipid acyltransferase family protein [Sutterellaceae bacterium]|nr:lysophospholipid acyltransferase family protein [Sutterellaceae bacterium]